jgi:hypothetical protein
MTLKKPKTNKVGKLHMPRISYSEDFADDAHAIQQLFVDRLPTHTLREVCFYISGYFHNKIITRDKRIKELQEKLEQLKNVSRETSEGDPKAREG